EMRLPELLGQALAAHANLLQRHARLADRGARFLGHPVRLHAPLVELPQLRLDLLDPTPRLLELGLDLDTRGELLLEAGAVGRERRLALLELPPDFLLAAAEMPELRLHPFQALRRGFLVGTAVLELDRDLVCRVAILLGAEAHSLQLLAQ